MTDKDGSNRQGDLPTEQTERLVVDEYGRDPKSVEIVSAYRKTINATPALLSLLYDADLLPEQIISVRAAVCMAAVCEAYRVGLQDAAAPDAASADEQVGTERSEVNQEILEEKPE